MVWKLAGILKSQAGGHSLPPTSDTPPTYSKSPSNIRMLMCCVRSGMKPQFSPPCQHKQSLSLWGFYYSSTSRFASFQAVQPTIAVGRVIMFDWHLAECLLRSKRKKMWIFVFVLESLLCTRCVRKHQTKSAYKGKAQKNTEYTQTEYEKFQ